MPPAKDRSGRRAVGDRVCVRRPAPTLLAATGSARATARSAVRVARHGVRPSRRHAARSVLRGTRRAHPALRGGRRAAARVPGRRHALARSSVGAGARAGLRSESVDEQIPEPGHRRAALKRRRSRGWRATDLGSCVLLERLHCVEDTEAVRRRSVCVLGRYGRPRCSGSRRRRRRVVQLSADPWVEGRAVMRAADPRTSRGAARRALPTPAQLLDSTRTRCAGSGSPAPRRSTSTTSPRVSSTAGSTSRGSAPSTTTPPATRSPRSRASGGSRPTACCCSRSAGPTSGPPPTWRCAEPWRASGSSTTALARRGGRPSVSASGPGGPWPPRSAYQPASAARRRRSRRLSSCGFALRGSTSRSASCGGSLVLVAPVAVSRRRSPSLRRRPPGPAGRAACRRGPATPLDQGRWRARSGLRAHRARATADRSGPCLLPVRGSSRQRIGRIGKHLRASHDLRSDRRP